MCFDVCCVILAVVILNLSLTFSTSLSHSQPPSRILNPPLARSHPSREVVQETREARERAAALKKKREEQAERKREMLKAAFLAKQLRQLKAKQREKESAGQGKP